MLQGLIFPTQTETGLLSENTPFYNVVQLIQIDCLTYQVGMSKIKQHFPGAIWGLEADSGCLHPFTLPTAGLSVTFQPPDDVLWPSTPVGLAMRQSRETRELTAGVQASAPGQWGTGV